MKRALAILLSMAIGTILGIVGVTLLIIVKSPTYYHDSGSPPLIAGIFLGGPVGFIGGLIVGFLIPLRHAQR